MLCNLPCRIVLIVVNTLTGIIGLAILIVGALMVWGKGVLVSILDHVITPLMSTVGAAKDDTQITQLVARLLSSTAPIGITLFSLGAALTILSFIGYCGSCCNYKILLYVYAGVVGVIALAVIVCVIVYFSMRDKLSNFVVELYAKHVRNYKSMAENNLDSLMVLLVQGQLECCGVDGPADFVSLTPTDTYNKVPYDPLKLPVPCCKVNKNYVLDDPLCPATPTDMNSYRSTPCRAIVKTKFIYYMNFAGYALIGVFVVLLLLLLFTVLTIKVDVV